MTYTSTVIADEHVELMTLEEQYFNLLIKVKLVNIFDLIRLMYKNIEHLKSISKERED